MLLKTPEEFRAYEEGNRFLSHNHIHIVSASPEGAVVCVDLCPDSCNYVGFVHGGLFLSMVDVAASQAAMANGQSYVTQNSFVNFLSNVKSGRLTATSAVVKRGKKTAVIHVQIHSEEGKLLVDASVTMMCTDAGK